MNVDPAPLGLEPALELSSYVAAVKLARAGESAGYGRRFVAEHETWMATVPIGYGDGVRRALTNNCELLIGGARYPLVGHCQHGQHHRRHRTGAGRRSGRRVT